MTCQGRGAQRAQRSTISWAGRLEQNAKSHPAANCSGLGYPAKLGFSGAFPCCRAPAPAGRAHGPPAAPCRIPCCWPHLVVVGHGADVEGNHLLVLACTKITASVRWENKQQRCGVKCTRRGRLAGQAARHRQSQRSHQSKCPPTEVGDVAVHAHVAAGPPLCAPLLVHLAVCATGAAGRGGPRQPGGQPWQAAWAGALARQSAQPVPAKQSMQPAQSQ